MDNRDERPGQPAAGPDAGRVYRTRYDPDGEETLTTAIACALATLEGVPPTRRPVRVADAIDTDALEAIFGPAAEPRGAERLDLHVGRYAVSVRRAGTIEIRERRERGESRP